MQPTSKPHVSHVIAWSLIALFAGSLAFGIWMYSNQIDTIYSGSANLTVTSKKTTTTKPSAKTTDTTAAWLTYTNETYNYSIQYPKELSYVESTDKKSVNFQTAAEKTAAAECATRTESDCTFGNEIYIDVDVNASTTNSDDLTATLKAIADTRIGQKTLNADPTLTTLGGQTAYESVSAIMISKYNLFTKYNDHIYDLTINCDEAVADATAETVSTKCKAVITTDQQKMIDSFTFTK